MVLTFLIVNQHGRHNHKEGAFQNTECRILGAYTIPQALRVANNDERYRSIAENVNGIVSVFTDTGTIPIYL